MYSGESELTLYEGEEDHWICLQERWMIRAVDGIKIFVNHTYGTRYGPFTGNTQRRINSGKHDQSGRH